MNLMMHKRFMSCLSKLPPGMQFAGCACLVFSTRCRVWGDALCLLSADSPLQRESPLSLLPPV